MGATQPTLMPLFVLAGVSKAGLQSLYALQREAGLQPGGIQPVLRQLETDGLLSRSPQERRRRRQLTVTAKGETALLQDWQSCLRDYADVESTLRAAAIALFMQQPRTAIAYLRGNAQTYERDRPSLSEDVRDRMAPLNSYNRMRHGWERARRECAAALFRQLADDLETRSDHGA